MILWGGRVYDSHDSPDSHDSRSFQRRVRCQSRSQISHYITFTTWNDVLGFLFYGIFVQSVKYIHDQWLKPRVARLDRGAGEELVRLGPSMQRDQIKAV